MVLGIGTGASGRWVGLVSDGAWFGSGGGSVLTAGAADGDGEVAGALGCGAGAEWRRAGFEGSGALALWRS